jgi:hypothetical protein
MYNQFYSQFRHPGLASLTKYSLNYCIIKVPVVQAHRQHSRFRGFRDSLFVGMRRWLEVVEGSKLTITVVPHITHTHTHDYFVIFGILHDQKNTLGNVSFLQ